MVSPSRIKDEGIEEQSPPGSRGLAWGLRKSIHPGSTGANFKRGTGA